jgi:hypothetical protein
MNLNTVSTVALGGYLFRVWINRNYLVTDITPRFPNSNHGKFYGAWIELNRGGFG